MKETPDYRAMLADLQAHPNEYRTVWSAPLTPESARKAAVVAAGLRGWIMHPHRGPGDRVIRGSESGEGEAFSRSLKETGEARVIGKWIVAAEETPDLADRSSHRADDDLAGWLLEQIAEDEDRARAATQGPWRHSPDKHWHKPGTTWFEEAVFAGPSGDAAMCVAGTGETDDKQAMADAAHIAAWDPARVLAECDAKRQIVDICAAAARSEGERATAQTVLAEETLRRLALPYSDRPGYCEEWKP